MSVTGAIIAGVGAAGSIAGGAIASHGAQKAASTAAAADTNAANLQYQLGEDQLGFEKGVYGNQQSEIAPFLNTGYSGLANLAYLAGILPGPVSPNPPRTGDTLEMRPLPAQATVDTSAFDNSDVGMRPAGRRFALQGDGTDFGASFNTNSPFAQWSTAGSTSGAAPSPAASGINTPKDLSSLVNTNLGPAGSLLQPFQAPDAVTEQNDPGYKFRLDTGLQQLDNSAAARGGLLSGGTAKALEDWAQQDASNEYGNVYNRAFNTFETNQTNTWNRLAALAGIGQQANTQLLGAGNEALSATGGTTASIGSQVGSSLSNAGLARATGYANSGNILGSTATGIGSQIGNLGFLNWLNNNTNLLG